MLLKYITFLCSIYLKISRVLTSEDMVVPEQNILGPVITVHQTAADSAAVSYTNCTVNIDDSLLKFHFEKIFSRMQRQTRMNHLCGNGFSFPEGLLCACQIRSL